MRNYPSDQVALAGGNIGAAVDNTTLASGYISLQTFDFVVFDIICLDANADTTIDAKIQSDVAAGGTNNDITGLAITQFTAAATLKMARLVVSKDDLNAGDTHARCLVTAGNGTTGAAIAIIANGYGSNYMPASNYDSALVQEVKTLDIS